MIKLIGFLDNSLGFRFVVWRYLVMLGIVVYMIASFSGAFQGWDAQGGPFSLVTMFALCSFLLLIPLGYLFENSKRATSMRYVGWVYLIFFVGWFIVAALSIYYQVFNGKVGLIGGVIRAFMFISFYSVFSVPLVVIYFLFGRPNKT